MINQLAQSLTEYGGLVCRGDAAGHRHQEHGHVQHGGDAQCNLLTGLSRNEKNKPDNENVDKHNDVVKNLQSQDVDEDRRLDVVEKEKLGSSPNDKSVTVKGELI